MANIDRYTSATASIKMKRSRMPLNHRVCLSYFHGYLQPVSVIEVLPGDTIKTNLSVFTRMSTPITTIMDNIRQEVDAFFVPKRVLWNKTKQFYGESESFGVATKVSEPYTIGYATSYLKRSDLDSPLKQSELFSSAFDLIAESDPTDYTGTNVLPLRAFLAIWNEFFRDQNYQDQYTWNKDSSGSLGSSSFAFKNGSGVNMNSQLPKVNKDKDLFVSILPYQQKGDPVTLSIGDSATVSGTVNIEANGALDLMDVSDSDMHGYVHFGEKITADQAAQADVYAYNERSDMFPDSNATAAYKGGLKATLTDATADLTSATAITINKLIYAVAYQDFLTKLAKGGSRYREYIYTMFGTTIADATEDIPEYLGRLKMRINVNEVLQTTGFDSSSASELGMVGAVSRSGSNKDMFTKSFTEPGYLMFVSYTKHQRTYGSGIDPMFLKHDLLDYYQTPFANTADVPVPSWLIYLGGANTELGFQEPYFDYRSKLDRVRGIINPMNANSLAFWTLTDVYANVPFIGDSFLQEDRSAIARALTTGETGPDYIMDFDFQIEATRVMPLYSRSTIGVF